MVVHGLNDGLDEMTTTAPTQISEVKANGVVRTYEIDAKDLGFDRATRDDLKVQTLEQGAQLIRDILNNRQSGPACDIVVLNAAAALVVADITTNLNEGIELARESIESGKATSALDSLAQISNT
jgi:anthranilate phosphoribosyltransferase